MGWFVGYDGHFLFENIGDSYIDNKVPYVAFRAMPALLGALTVPVVFDIMWESGYTLPACVVASGRSLSLVALLGGGFGSPGQQIRIHCRSRRI
jgi:dolichyl-phosphate-mannose--protein O-mannosyl transferase